VHVSYISRAVIFDVFRLAAVRVIVIVAVAPCRGDVPGHLIPVFPLLYVTALSPSFLYVTAFSHRIQ
jgi:hypothetical protein